MDEKIAYFHVRNEDDLGQLSPRGGLTVAMNPIQGWYFKTLADNRFFEERVGIAVCSEEDNYCKKTGRDLAKSRMKATTLTVLDTWMVGDNKCVALGDTKNKCEYVFIQYADSDRVYLLGACRE